MVVTGLIKVKVEAVLVLSSIFFLFVKGRKEGNGSSSNASDLKLIFLFRVLQSGLHGDMFRITISSGDFSLRQFV